MGRTQGSLSSRGAGGRLVKNYVPVQNETKVTSLPERQEKQGTLPQGREYMQSDKEFFQRWENTGSGAKRLRSNC